MITRLCSGAVGALLLCAAPAVAHAQNETLISGNASTGGFGGPHLRVTRAAGETVALSGGGGGLLIGRRFAIGGSGFGSTARVDAIIAGSSIRGEMDIRYGGLTLAFVTQPSKLVHSTFGILLGAGGVSVWEDDLRPSDRSAFTQKFRVLEPHIGLQVSVVRWMRVGVAGGYRAVIGADVPELVNDNLSGASGTFFVRFGAF